VQNFFSRPVAAPLLLVFGIIFSQFGYGCLERGWFRYTPPRWRAADHFAGDQPGSLLGCQCWGSYGWFVMHCTFCLCRVLSGSGVSSRRLAAVSAVIIRHRHVCYRLDLYHRCITCREVIAPMTPNHTMEDAGAGVLSSFDMTKTLQFTATRALIHSRYSFSLRPKVYVMACQSISFARSSSSWSR
jgi:hypothetical protein